MSEVRTEIRYTDEHEWVAPTEGDGYRIGITDHAQDELGDIVYVGDFPDVGDLVPQGDVVGVVESTKATSDIYAPISGTIVAVNEELEDTPEHLNASPYEDGWLLAIAPSKAEELEELLTAAAYTELLG